MLQPDEKTLRAITSLERENSENWKTFMDWVTNSYSIEGLNTNEIDDPTRVPISQGSVRQLRQLIFIVKNSQEQLERLQTAIKQANSV